MGLLIVENPFARDRGHVHDNAPRPAATERGEATANWRPPTHRRFIGAQHGPAPTEARAEHRDPTGNANNTDRALPIVG